MVLDIIVILILLIFAVYGFRKGFIFTLIHTVGWAIALVGTYFAVSGAADFIREHTSFYDWMLEGYKERFSVGDLDADSAMESLPGSFSFDPDDTIGAATDAVAKMFANMTYLVVIFVGLFLLIKILMWLILRFFSRDYKEGFTGFFDGFFGMLFSLLKGAILIFLLLAVFVPFTNLVAPDLAAAFLKQLDTSYLTKYLYDNNILLILAENFFRGIF